MARTHIIFNYINGGQVMVLFNATSEIGILTLGIQSSLTGNLFLTLLAIVMFLVALCLAFRLPIELTIPLIFPILLVFMVLSSQFMVVLGVALLYVSSLVANRFFLN